MMAIWFKYIYANVWKYECVYDLKYKAGMDNIF